MAKNQMMGSTVMTAAERKRIAEQQKARQKEREKIKKERATASEFGAAMSPTMSSYEKALASKRSNPNDLRFTGTKQTQRVKAAGEKVASKQRKITQAAEIQRKIAQAASKKPTSKVAAGKNYNLGVSKGGVPFKEAFAHFRKKGYKTFTWNGKKYTTELAKAKKGK